MAQKRLGGFAGMDRERVREIAAAGGRAAHALGAAHEWNAAEARAAGRKGGQAPRHHARPTGPRTQDEVFEPDDPTGRAAMRFWSGPREQGGEERSDTQGGMTAAARGELAGGASDKPPFRGHDGVERPKGE